MPDAVCKGMRTASRERFGTHGLKGEEVALFCVLKPESAQAAGDGLREEIGEAVVAVLGKTLRPGRVVLVPELPKTRNAKVMRRVVRALCVGSDALGDLSGLENASRSSSGQRSGTRNMSRPRARYQCSTAARAQPAELGSLASQRSSLGIFLSRQHRRAIWMPSR